MSMMDILSCSLVDLSLFLKEQQEPSFRAQQIFDWIYHKKILSYASMSSLSKNLRHILEEKRPFPILLELKRDVSKDGTTKFLWKLSDGQTIETVYIPTQKRRTLCISSQAGCKFGCRFCASGLGGWKRNLTTGEIIAQVLRVCDMIKPEQITHLVFMGVGEPFDNYDQVLKAVRTLNAPEGLGIAARRITISTCGIIDGIHRFAQENIQVELSVSLHAPFDDVRSQLMPVNQRYKLKDLIQACKQYAQKTNRQVTFEYILIKNMTSTPKAAEALALLMKGWLSKINLIPCNAIKEFSYQPPSRVEIVQFKQILEKKGIVVTLRTPRGEDVSAACGQLRHTHQK